MIVRPTIICPGLKRSETPFSDGQIIVGRIITDDKHCKHAFDNYIQTHESHDNSMDTRTTDAIALRPTGNAQGGYYFYILQTGRRIDRVACTPIPVPQLVIDRIHALADQARIQGNLIFTDRDDNIFLEDDEEDDDYDPKEDNQEDVPLILPNNDDLAAELQDITGVDDENENHNDNEPLVHPENDNDNKPLVHLDIKQENEQ